MPDDWLDGIPSGNGWHNQDYKEVFKVWERVLEEKGLETWQIRQMLGQLFEAASLETQEEYGKKT